MTLAEAAGGPASRMAAEHGGAPRGAPQSGGSIRAIFTWGRGRSGTRGAPAVANGKVFVGSGADLVAYGLSH